MTQALTSIQGRILDLLSEAGEENICCIANTLAVRPEGLLDLYVALKGLQAMGTVQTSLALDKTALADHLGMVYRNGNWKWPSTTTIPDVFLS